MEYMYIYYIHIYMRYIYICVYQSTFSMGLCIFLVFVPAYPPHPPPHLHTEASARAGLRAKTTQRASPSAAGFWEHSALQNRGPRWPHFRSGGFPASNQTTGGNIENRR